MHVEAGLDAEFVNVDHSDYLKVKVVEYCKKHVDVNDLKAWGVIGKTLAKGIGYCQKLPVGLYRITLVGKRNRYYFLSLPLLCLCFGFFLLVDWVE